MYSRHKSIHDRFISKIMANGYTEEQAEELLTERKKLQCKLFKKEAFIHVDENNPANKRLEEINRIIFNPPRGN